MAKAALPVSPLAPKRIKDLPVLKGVRFSAAAAGIKYAGRTDVMVMVFDEPAQVAGALTTSKCPSAPVEMCRENLSGGLAKVVVVNSGNANAFTGEKGRQATQMTADAAAKAASCSESAVFLSSTGVIGEPLDASKFAGLLGGMVKDAKPNGWLDAAKAIMTTDTYPKLATAKARIEDIDVLVNGIAKGSGMIAPDMATMLSYIVTDIPVAADILQKEVSRLVKTTFNAITVDSDTSTSDTLLVFSTGAAKLNGGPIEKSDDARLPVLRRLLKKVFHNLAQQIVRDGEGARKLLEVQVTGAKSSRSARKIASSIANSPLVKTAIAGEDANWGRVVMAVGKAGEPAERDLLSISFGPHRVAHEGARDPSYSEAQMTDYMTRDEIVLSVDIGLGRGKATLWTCDLTKEYVAINGDYRS